MIMIMIDKINEQLNSLIGKVMFYNELITSYEFDENNNKIILNITDANCMYKYVIHNAITNNTKETYIAKQGAFNIDTFSFGSNFDCIRMEPIFGSNFDCIRMEPIFVEDEHQIYPASVYKYLTYDKIKELDKHNYFKVLQL